MQVVILSDICILCILKFLSFNSIYLTQTYPRHFEAINFINLLKCYNKTLVSVSGLNYNKTHFGIYSKYL